MVGCVYITDVCVCVCVCYCTQIERERAAMMDHSENLHAGNGTTTDHMLVPEQQQQKQKLVLPPRMGHLSEEVLLSTKPVGVRTRLVLFEYCRARCLSDGHFD